MRIGRTLRALRHRLSWRQADVAVRAGVSQALVSRAERGDIDRTDVATLRRLTGALGAELVVTIRWRGGDLDRLLDEGHATIVGAVSLLLDAHGWLVQPEVTFAVYGERGAVDKLAAHEPTRTLLVVEVKTELVSIEETLRRHDAKARLGTRIAAERFGWSPRAVARLLVLPDLSTPRRRVARHEAVLGRAYPLRGLAARAWLRNPSGAPGALLFLAVSRSRGVTGGDGGVSRKRVRRAAGPSP